MWQPHCSMLSNHSQPGIHPPLAFLQFQLPMQFANRSMPVRSPNLQSMEFLVCPANLHTDHWSQPPPMNPTLHNPPRTQSAHSVHLIILYLCPATMPQRCSAPQPLHSHLNQFHHRPPHRQFSDQSGPWYKNHSLTPPKNPTLSAMHPP